VLAAGFQQNALQRVRPGDEAEVAFDAIPGRVFKAKVRNVLDAIALGQLQATGTLQDMGAAIPGGRAVATIDIEEDTSGYNIPGGAAAQVAVYTPYAHHSLSSGRSYCACGAGRTSYSSKATEEVATVVAISTNCVRSMSRSDSQDDKGPQYIGAVR